MMTEESILRGKLIEAARKLESFRKKVTSVDTSYVKAEFALS